MAFKAPTDPTKHVAVENMGTRTIIGGYVFEPRAGYKYPIAMIPYDEANKLVISDERDQATADAKYAKLKQDYDDLTDKEKRKKTPPVKGKVQFLRFAVNARNEKADTKEE